MAFHHDERPVAVARQRLDGTHHLAQHAVVVAAQERAEVPRAAELGERVAQLGLEQDDEGDEPDGLEALGDPADGDQVELARGERHDHDDQEPHVHLRRAGALDQDEQAIEEHRDQEDVDEVEEPQGMDWVHRSGSG